MLIISDCGATKADWAVIRDGEAVLRFSTCGFNAAVENNAHKLASSLKTGLERASFIPGDRFRLCIYCAGVVSATLASEFSASFHDCFSGAQVEVCSDMLGAARAVCGHNPGVIGIIGTGSNSCLYDGETITVPGKGGGYVLGDEASGAWFGKALLSDFIRNLLPDDISRAIVEEYGLDYPSIVRGVYRSDAPSAYLASFFPFIQRHMDSGYVQELIRQGVALYFDRVLAPFAGKGLPLSLCGSVACICEHQIRQCASERAWTVSRFLQSPLDGLIEYHTNGI
ncbi:MAG: hypothetical protein SO114_09650 [Candidatus Cryptobacteroides sp.]|nr:hypothetical protein [Candidatus Cryptobacteroides sp.]